MDYLTVGELKEVIVDLPDDCKVYYERIQDLYFEKNGWKATPLASDAWYERAGFVNEDGSPCENEPGEWIDAYEAFYNKKENALKITAHY